MNSGLLKKLLPHLLAIIVFLIVTVFFCRPVLEGNVLKQSDIIGWKSMAQDAFQYKETHGHFPLWNTHLFSGMPNYQVAMEGKSILPNFTDIMSLWLPKPMNFFFLACICFYILCLAFRLNPYIGMLGSLAFAFSTYNPIIVGVGHDSKMLAIAYMPLLLAGMIFTYEKRYWLGIAVTTLGAFLEIAVNHPQINYYFLLIATAVSIAYLVNWIRNKEWKHMVTALAIVLVSALIGLAGSAVTLLTTYEYSKATMRGGKDIDITGDTVKVTKTTGLDTSYAFQYSFSKPEALVALMPKAFGEKSSTEDGRLYGLPENSNVIKKLTEKGIDEGAATQLATQQLPRYWGGAASTAGPAYVGALICLLALIGFVVVKNPLRWGLLAVTVLGVMMAWGKYLPGFNAFLFEHLPMYNKFRAPSMSMVIPEFTLPVMAVLTLQFILYRENSQQVLQKEFRKILYAVGGLFGILIILYLTLSYTGAVDNEIYNGVSQMAKSDELGRAVISGMKADRRDMFGGQLLRTFGFAILLLALLYLYGRKLIKPMVVILAIAVVSTIELLAIDNNYLNAENFVSPDQMKSQNFTPTLIEQQIAQDRDPNFRVFNPSENPVYDLRSPYFYKPITGYHPARLRIYQDIIDKYFGTGNQNVLNMLNTKYIILTNQQNNQQQLLPNPNAYGPCWLVKSVKFVKDAAEEIKAIGVTNLRDTAIVQDTFRNVVTQPAADSTATLKMTKFDNDTMDYAFNGAGPAFVVFSEVYYPYGWNAYVDGKKAEYCKADYVLRGLSLPAGQHNIRFIFEPKSYKTGNTIAYTASFLILIILLGGFYMEWRSSRKQPVRRNEKAA